MISWAGIMRHMKFISLALLVLQNTVLVLLMRYSRTVQGPMYIASTAVFSMEVVKLVVCNLMLFLDAGGWAAYSKKLQLEVVAKPFEVLKLSVPSFLYMVQNNLLYIALSNLDAATYSVCYQTKIITTAIFSKYILGKHLSQTQWQALLLLFVGVALAETGSQLAHGSGGRGAAATGGAAAAGEDAGAAATAAAAAAMAEELVAMAAAGGAAVAGGGSGIDDTSVEMVAARARGAQNHLWGFMCVLLAACTSGFAGVYFELLLKRSNASLWVRNIQMGLPSVALSLASVFVSDRRAVARDGFFQGYSGIVASVVVLQAVGGLVVAVVVKYADNILKGFAAAFSILTSCALSAAFFAFEPSAGFIAGACLVIVSTFMYVSAPPPTAAGGKGGGAGGGVSGRSGSSSNVLLPTFVAPKLSKAGKPGL